MRDRFEGWYYKHQKGKEALALIPGRSEKEAFIQVVTTEGVYNANYNLGQYQKGKTLRVGESLFTPQGVKLDIHTETLDLTGKIFYECLTPVCGDIMGPFRFLPMECRHQIVSLHHRLTGKVRLNGRLVDFTDGRGYIEGDRGSSFPKRYTWVQCNDFEEKCSVMASAALIPFGGRSFWGCVAIIWFRGVEYRIATYKGGKIKTRNNRRLELVQGKYRLVAELPETPGFGLMAPEKGEMCRTVFECIRAPVRFCFFAGEKLLFDRTSENASFEFVE